MHTVMNLVLFSLDSLFFTSLIGCSKPAKPFEEQHVLNLKKEFKNWQQSQIEKGVYLDSSRCNLEYFWNNYSIELSTIGFPNDSLIRFNFGYINDDNVLDMLVVYNLVSCDCAAIFNNSQNDLLFISDKQQGYAIKEDYFMKFRHKLGFGNLYIDSLNNSKVYASYYEHLDDDPNCCPSYMKNVEIDMKTEQMIIK